MMIRDMDIAAVLMGIRPLQTKLMAFAVSSYICGVAGAMMVFFWLNAAEPSSYSIRLSFQVLFMVILGGLGSLGVPIHESVLLEMGDGELGIRSLESLTVFTRELLEQARA